MRQRHAIPTATQKTVMWTKRWSYKSCMNHSNIKRQKTRNSRKSSYFCNSLPAWLINRSLVFNKINLSPVKVVLICFSSHSLISETDPQKWKKNYVGAGVYQKMLTKLESWLRRSFNWNCLKCPELLNKVVLDNANSQHK